MSRRTARRRAAAARARAAPTRPRPGSRPRCAPRGGCSATPKCSASSEALRGRNWSAPGPWNRCLPIPTVTDVLVNAPDEVWVDRGRRAANAPGSRFADAAGGAQARAAARRGRRAGGWTTPGPGWTPGSRTAPGCMRCCRRSSSARTCLSLRVVRPRAFSLDGAGRGRHRAAGRRPAAAGAAGGPALVSDQRWHGRGEDHAAEQPAGRCRDRERIVLAEDSAELRPGPPACGAPGDPSCQPGGRGPGDPAGPGAPGAADAAGPAGGRRGARCRGHGAAGRAEHRPRGRLRHGPRERGRAMSRPGWRRSARRPGSTGPRCTASWRRRCRWWSISYGTGPGCAGSPRSHVLERDAAGLVVTVPALRWGADGFVRERGWERLRSLIGGATVTGGSSAGAAAGAGVRDIHDGRCARGRPPGWRWGRTKGCGGPRCCSSTGWVSRRRGAAGSGALERCGGDVPGTRGSGSVCRWRWCLPCWGSPCCRWSRGRWRCRWYGGG